MAQPRPLFCEADDRVAENARGRVQFYRDGVELLRDPRIVEIVRRALAYRGTAGGIVESGADRLAIRLDDVFGARIDANDIDSAETVTTARLDAMATAGAPFADLLWTEEAAS